MNLMNSTYLVLMFGDNREYGLGHPAWAFMGTWESGIPEVYKYSRMPGRTDYAKLVVI